MRPPRSAALTALSHHSRTQSLKDTFLALSYFNGEWRGHLGLYPLRPIFSAGVTSLFSVEDAAQFYIEIHSLHMDTQPIWTGFLILPWNIYVVFSHEERQDGVALVCTEASSLFGIFLSIFLSFFLSHWDSDMLNLLCILKAISTYYFNIKKLFA